MSTTIPDAFSDVLRIPEVRTQRFVDDGTYPNNEALPVLLMEHVLLRKQGNQARTFERVFLPSFDPVYGSDGPLVEHWDLAS